MSTKLPADQGSPFTIIMPEDDAFELSLFQLDGEDSARLFFTGASSRQTVNLVPGRYRARVTSVSQKGTVGFSLELSPQSKEVRIADYLQADDNVTVSYAVPALRPRPSDTLKLSDRPTANNAIWVSASSSSLSLTDSASRSTSTALKTFDALNAPSLALGTEFASFLLERGAQAALPGFTGQRFAIGLSETDGSRWRPASKLSITPEIRDDLLTLTIKQPPWFEDFHHPFIRRRLRLSMSIAGKPTIRMHLPMFKGGIAVYFRPFGPGGTGDVALTSEPLLPKARSLIGALSSLSDDDALAVVKWVSGTSTDSAIEALLEKRSDLWLATAAALILCRTRRLTATTANWVFNLARLAPQIGDASIAAAWASAFMSEGNSPKVEVTILDYLRAADEQGRATFRVGQKMAIDLLAMLRASAQDPEVRRRARIEILKWYAHNRSQLSTGTYVLWENHARYLTKGKFPRNRYLTVAAGRLDEGFRDMSFEVGTPS